jgi:hypothetical protein
MACPYSRVDQEVNECGANDEGSDCEDQEPYTRPRQVFHLGCLSKIQLIASCDHFRAGCIDIDSRDAESHAYLEIWGGLVSEAVPASQCTRMSFVKT